MKSLVQLQGKNQNFSFNPNFHPGHLTKIFLAFPLFNSAPPSRPTNPISKFFHPAQFTSRLWAVTSRLPHVLAFNFFLIFIPHLPGPPLKNEGLRRGTYAGWRKTGAREIARAQRGARAVEAECRKALMSTRLKANRCAEHAVPTPPPPRRAVDAISSSGSCGSTWPGLGTSGAADGGCKEKSCCQILR